MPSLFVVGLPKGLKLRLNTAARPNNLALDFILADVNGAGMLRLIPTDETAIEPLKNYTMDKDIPDVRVVVLPYAPIPKNLTDELCTLEEMGASVEWAEPAKNSWPWLDGAVTPTFSNSLFRAFEVKYFPTRAPTPSEHFFSLANANEQLLITNGSLDECDDVPPHRRKFLISSADACSDLSITTLTGTVDEFFKGREILHAQNSKEKGKLTITKAGKQLYSEVRETHLKQGDKTTRAAAARVYYHYLAIGDFKYVAILHAGPHPSGDMTKIHVL